VTFSDNSSWFSCFFTLLFVSFFGRQHPRTCLWKEVFKENTKSYLVYLNSWQSGKCLKKAWPKRNVLEHFSQVQGCEGLYKLGCHGSLASNLVNRDNRIDRVCLVSYEAGCCCNHSSWIFFCCCPSRVRSSLISFCCLAYITVSLLCP
jgi:hypothetical protein